MWHAVGTFCVTRWENRFRGADETVLILKNKLFELRPPPAQHCRSCSGISACQSLRGVAGDGTEGALAVACGGEGECPALACAGWYACTAAMLRCPEGRRCSVPTAVRIE